MKIINYTKLLIIITGLVVAGCSSKVIVKNCEKYIGDYLQCEVVEQ